jgi:hypothetical protein
MGTLKFREIPCYHWSQKRLPSITQGSGAPWVWKQRIFGFLGGDYRGGPFPLLPLPPFPGDSEVSSHRIPSNQL